MKAETQRQASVSHDDPKAWEILEETARGLRGAGPMRPSKLESLLEPAVLREAERSLDEFASEEA